MKYSPMKIVQPLREMHLYVFQKKQYVAYNRGYHRYIIRKRVDRVPITQRYIYIYIFFFNYILFPCMDVELLSRNIDQSLMHCIKLLNSITLQGTCQ